MGNLQGEGEEGGGGGGGGGCLLSLTVGHLYSLLVAILENLPFFIKTVVYSQGFAQGQFVSGCLLHVILQNVRF